MLSLAAGSYRAAGGAEVAAVFADHGVIPAFAAQFAGGWLGGGAADRGLKNTHLLQWHAGLVEDAEHGVAVDDQLREVSDR